jgi:hypothetical protein
MHYKDNIIQKYICLCIILKYDTIHYDEPYTAGNKKLSERVMEACN